MPLQTALLAFNPRKVPYQYLCTLDKLGVRVRWDWNYVTRQFMFSLLDPDTDALLWRRPVLYGTNLLHGCTVDGLQRVAIVPTDAAGAFREEGITPENIEAIQMWVMIYG